MTEPDQPAANPAREPAAMSVRGAAVWAMGGQYLTFAIQFATSVIISRFFLEPAEVGLFSIALAAALLVAVLQDFGLSRYISGLPQLTPEEVRRCSSVALIFSVLIAGLIALAAWPLARLYDMPQLWPLLTIIAGSYLFVPLAVVPMALMARSMRFHGHFAVNVGSAAVQAGVALSLAAMGFSSFSLAWATLAAGLAKGVIAQILQPGSPFPLRLDGLRPVVSFGSKTSALYLTGALGSRTPDLIVGKLVNLAAVGLYSRASGLADQFRTLIAGAIGSVFYPAFARIRDRGEPLGPAYLRVCAGYMAIVWPGMAWLALAAEPIVRILYGEAWLGTAPLLTLVALHSGLMMALPLVSELPILLGRLNRLILLNVAETIMSIALLVAGSVMAGALGAAASRLVYAVAFMLLYFPFMRVVVGFDLRSYFQTCLRSALATAAAVLPLALGYALVQPPSHFGFIGLVASAAAGAVLWLAAMVALRHPAMDDLRGIAVAALKTLGLRLPPAARLARIVEGGQA